MRTPPPDRARDRRGELEARRAPRRAPGAGRRRSSPRRRRRASRPRLRTAASAPPSRRTSASTPASAASRFEPSPTVSTASSSARRPARAAPRARRALSGRANRARRAAGADRREAGERDAALERVLTVAPASRRARSAPAPGRCRRRRGRAATSPGCAPRSQVARPPRSSVGHPGGEAPEVGERVDDELAADARRSAARAPGRSR